MRKFIPRAIVVILAVAIMVMAVASMSNVEKGNLSAARHYVIPILIAAIALRYIRKKEATAILADLANRAYERSPKQIPRAVFRQRPDEILPYLKQDERSAYRAAHERLYYR